MLSSNIFLIEVLFEVLGKDELFDLLSTIKIKSDAKTVFELIQQSNVSEDYIFTSLDTLDTYLNGILI